MDEFGVIERFFKRQRVRRGDVPLDIGDDAAVVRMPAGLGAVRGELAITTDVLVSGVHFPEKTDPAAVGHKALAVNLSDIAAMGAEPAWATMGITMPRIDEPWLEAFSSGFFALAEQYDVQLIGGDVTKGPLSIAVQLIGIVDDSGYLTRAGAEQKDVIFVSGVLGDAALGLEVVRGALSASKQDESYLKDRLDRPSPRVRLGQALVGHATAAIDISDGLAADLAHLCEISRAGAVVDVADVPISDCYRRSWLQMGWEPALTFGDDYELCFTVPPQEVSVVERISRETDVSVSCIGHIEGYEIVWLNKGEPFSIHEKGYRHFR